MIHHRSARRELVVLAATLLLAAGCAPASAPVVTPPTAQPAPLASAAPSPTPAAPTPTPAPACPETRGQVETGEVDSAALGKPLPYRVYLPPCAERAPAGGWPVLYLLHGQGFSDDQWERLGVADTLDAGELPPFVVVMPQETADLADPALSPYGDALLNDLLPALEARYGLCGQRACRAIGGLSRGAAWAMRLTLTHPDAFGAAGLHSLPPFLGDENKVKRWLAAIPIEERPRLYLDIGRSDRYLAPARAFEAELSKAGFAHEWYLRNGDHDETYWAAHTPEYLAWYAAGFE